MKMQKGLCIEMNGEFSIFLGPNGEFVEGKPAGELAVGEQGYFYPKQAMAVKKRRTFKPVWAPVLAALAVAVLFLSVLLPNDEAFAYIQVQVNPGIELGIDEAYEVVSVRGLNKDGRELIGEMGDWKNHSLEEILDRVIDLTLEKATDEIVITTVADEEDEVADQEVVDSVMAISAKVMAEDLTVRLKEASKKQWRTSVEQKVPVGQLVNQSEKLTKEEPDTKPAEAEDEQPPIEEKRPPADVKQQEKTKKPEEKVKKQEEKKEEKLNRQPEKTDKKENRQEEKVNRQQEKDMPPSQDKRKETPAAEKGNPAPAGQIQRDIVPGQDKKTEAPGPPANKGKEHAPGQQKKKEKNEKDKDQSSKTKGPKENNKPAHAGPKNSNGNNGNNGKQKGNGPNNNDE